MPNKWTDFVKDWASKNNTSYGCALSKPEMRTEYHKKNPKPVTKKQEKANEVTERATMGGEDIRSKIVETQNKKIKLLDKYSVMGSIRNLNKMPGGRAELRDVLLTKQMKESKEKGITPLAKPVVKAGGGAVEKTETSDERYERKKKEKIETIKNMYKTGEIVLIRDDGERVLAKISKISDSGITFKLDQIDENDYRSGYSGGEAGYKYKNNFKGATRRYTMAYLLGRDEVNEYIIKLTSIPTRFESRKRLDPGA